MSAVNLCFKNVGIFVCPVSISPLLSSPLPENWQYIHTVCAKDWLPHNGFCYRVLSEGGAGSWEESSQACGSQRANLTSLHSLSEVEMLLSLLANCKTHHVTQKCKVLLVVATTNIYQVDTRHCFVCVNMNAMFRSFWGEFVRVDRSLETSIVADCRVV